MPRVMLPLVATPKGEKGKKQEGARGKLSFSVELMRVLVDPMGNWNGSADLS